MKRLPRQTAAAALLAVTLSPAVAMAQRGNAQRNPIFVAATFHSPGEPRLGIEIAEAVRGRMLKFFPLPPKVGQLRVITGAEIGSFLTSGGFSPDSALSTLDLGLLGKNLGAEESLEGFAKRTAQGIEVRGKFYSLNFMGAAEVLPVVVEKDAVAAGRKLAEVYVQARKELPDYQRCRNGLINRDLDAAVVAAKAALVQYEQGVLPRACLMGAYVELQKSGKMPIDSVMRVGLEILSIDPDNIIAVGTLADAYRMKGDTARSIEMNLRLYGLDAGQAPAIINELRYWGADDKALRIVDDRLGLNQGDVSLLETRWKLLQATGQWKAALAAGEEMIKFDSSKADTTFFWRQIGAAQKDSQPKLMLQLLDRVTIRFPKDARLWLVYSQELRKQGRLQESLDAAKKALALDPAIGGGQLSVLNLYITLGQSDSAMAFSRQALAANPDSATKSSIAAGLLTLVRPAMDSAQKQDTMASVSGAQKLANWAEVFRISASVDTLIPQGSTAFFMSFAAYNIVGGILPGLQETARTDRVQACSDLKYASDMLLVIDLNMARGGKYKPTEAANILNAMAPVRPYLTQTRTQLRCAPTM